MPNAEMYASEKRRVEYKMLLRHIETVQYKTVKKKDRRALSKAIRKKHVKMSCEKILSEKDVFTDSNCHRCTLLLPEGWELAAEPLSKAKVGYLSFPEDSAAVLINSSS